MSDDFEGRLCVWPADILLLRNQSLHRRRRSGLGHRCTAPRLRPSFPFPLYTIVNRRYLRHSKPASRVVKTVSELLCYKPVLAHFHAMQNESLLTDFFTDKKGSTLFNLYDNWYNQWDKNNKLWIINRFLKNHGSLCICGNWCSS